MPQPMRNIHDTIRGELPHAFNNSNPRHREKLPAMNPGRNPPTRAHPDYGNPDLTRAVLAAARRPGHPLYEEVKKRGKSPYEVWMVVAEVRYTSWVEGRECWLDAVVENVRAGMTRGHGHKHGEDRGQGGDRVPGPEHIGHGDRDGESDEGDEEEEDEDEDEESLAGSGTYGTNHRSSTSRPARTQ